MTARGTPAPTSLTWDAYLDASPQSTDATAARIRDNVVTIVGNWGARWRGELKAGGLLVQETPSFHLALSLARLSAFEPSIPAILSLLPDFHAHQAAHLAVGPKHVDPTTTSLFGEVEQRVTCTSYRVLNEFLDYLKSSEAAPLPSSVTNRSRRAAQRDKRKVPASRRSTPSPSGARQRPSPASPEVGRGHDSSLIDRTLLGPEEEPSFAQSGLDDSGVVFDPEASADDLSLPLPLPRPHTTTSPSSTASPPPASPSTMGEDLEHLLQDRLWAQVTQLLSTTRKRATHLKLKASEAKTVLDEAKAKEVEARHAIGIEFGLLEPTVDVETLEKAIEELNDELTAEEELRDFKAKYQAEFVRLASRARSAAGEANALDTTACDEQISRLEAEIERHEAAVASLKEVEEMVAEKEDEWVAAADAVTADKKRKKTFQDLAKNVNSDLLFKGVDAALAARGDEGEGDSPSESST
ncbi:hypothetical protein P153DRAFT_147369 [Dothidotthia symphoricarpi CBS 119687]|uniref:Uncharacterized protein n=1 Tax=Dothidotthia symphoricarpi CBS 119687 TaxID=1392245 RepID=A0A6A5ZZ39_9PLEO|nr:uncharacterized protein P153DRAFT_147369 [Dothidotthia symphoricarpi CBS 119687]KAF2123678.1 hypothetical protein P153DRAFT_147369 [Dothidotthia symphoricarpi CBS 119687]